MTRAEIDDACFARYLLESGAVCEERAVIDDTLLAALGTELDAMVRAVDGGDLARGRRVRHPPAQHLVRASAPCSPSYGTPSTARWAP